MRSGSLMTWEFDESTGKLSQWGAVEDIYGYSQNDFQNNTDLWYSVIHPDDQKYLNLARESCDLLNNPEVAVKYRIIHKTGSIKSVLGTIKIERRQGKIIYSGYIVDMSFYNQISIRSDFGENLFPFFKKSISILFSTDSEFETSGNTVLEKLSNVLDIDRITVYKATNKKGNRLELYKLTDAKNNDIGNSTAAKSTFSLNSEGGFKRWHQKLVVDKLPIHDIVRLLPRAEKEYFEKIGVKSLLVIPIYIDQNFFGFIRFDDLKTERYWSSNSIQVLSSFGQLFASSYRYHNSQKLLKNSVSKLQQSINNRNNFLRLLSHQYKTPLSIIELNFRMLQNIGEIGETEKQNKHQKKVERINRSLKSLRELNNDILQISTVNPGYYESDNIDIQHAIDEVVKKYSDVASNVKIEKNYKQVHMDVYLPISGTLFKRLFEILLSNSIKYAKDDSQTVEIYVDIVDQNILIKVKDYGIGIPSEDLERIGRAFYRGGNVGNIEGSGIGLRIVKEVLDMIDGKLQIDSQINKYTEIMIKIPLETI